MIHWAFIWASKRPPVWENCTDVMNLAIGDKWTVNGLYLPVNSGVSSIANIFKDDKIKRMTGPIIEQFEIEAFKYVIETNNSAMNLDLGGEPGQLILKEHMMLDINLTPDNSRTIDLNEVYAHLEKHAWVALGIPISNMALNKKTLMAKSYYYTRDDNFNIINLSGDNHPIDGVPSIAAVTYCVFKKTKNSNLVTCILNPHLVAMPSIDSNVYEGKHHVFTLDAYDATLEEYFLVPRIEGSGTYTVNKNTIFTTTEFTIHEYEGGTYFSKFGDKIKFNREIKSNLTFKAKDGKIIVDPSRHFGYITIEYDVDGMINRYDRVAKAGKYKIEFIVAKG